MSMILPHLNWFMAMFRKLRTENGEQTTEAERDYYKVEVFMRLGMSRLDAIRQIGVV